jgi:hypothetical protein
VNPIGSGLEQPIDEPAADLRYASEDRKPEGAPMAEETKRIPLGELRVLEIDDGEVEAARRDEIDDLGRRELHEQPSDAFAEIQHL